MRLDYQRFTSDAVLGCYLAERDIIKQHSDAPVTTNFMALNCPSMDLWAWSQEVDIVSNDYYLEAADPRGHIKLALDADLTRSIARGKPWILMEHSTSGVNWQDRNVSKRPLEMARNSLSTLARGADGILFFQWRAARFGAEKFHSAILPHAGVDSRIFREACQLGATLKDYTAAGVPGSGVDAKVALLWDWESFWAQDLEWRPSIDASHRERTLAFYTQLWEDNITVDFAHPEQDLSRYDLVVAPASYLLTDESASNLETYVRAGGKLVMSYFSGIVDHNDTIRHGGFSAAVDNLLGIRIEEFLPLRKDDSYRISLGNQLTEAAGEATLVGDVWADDITVNTAQVMATYIDGPNPGGAAITRNEFGNGVAWYVSSRLTGANLKALLNAVYADAAIAPDRETPADFEVVRRQDAEHEFTFLINHTNQEVRYSGAVASASGASASRVSVSGIAVGSGASGESGVTVVPAGEVVMVKTSL